MASNQKTGNKF